jgi:hypothetical protein
MPSFDEDYQWQRKFAGHYCEIIRQVLGVAAEAAPEEEDWRRNTDFVGLSAGVRLGRREYRISARARRHGYAARRDQAGARYADQFTVRRDRPSGYATETPKLCAGYGDFTIYGFESAPGSDRLGPWFLGNAAMLADYIDRGGYGAVEANHDGSSTFTAYHLADMPLGFVLGSEGLRVWADDRMWEECRRCWLGGNYRGRCYVMPTDEDRRPGTGYGRLCPACGFWWRSGWIMSLTRGGAS